jgi:hypothetical protein
VRRRGQPDVTGIPPSILSLDGSWMCEGWKEWAVANGFSPLALLIERADRRRQANYGHRSVEG